MKPTPVELDPHRETGSNPDAHDPNDWLADAPTDGTIHTPDRSIDRASDRPPLSATTNPLVQPIVGLPRLSLRASSLVTAAVLLRVAGYDQLRRLAYEGKNVSAVRKDVREAVDAGWLQRWSYPIARHGRIGYVHPTARANAVVLAALRTSSKSRTWDPLVRLMLPATPRPSLELTRTPKWFAHQREVNHLLTSIAIDRSPLWASSWNEPFPPTVNGLTMPQPDYVLVEDSGGHIALVFGEHDRGHEPVERFVARKVALYTRLAGACEPLLGVRSFRVDVSVIDAVSRQPMERLQTLQAATRAYGAADMFQFTLAGWLHADALRATWFHKIEPGNNSHRMSDHVRAS